MRSPGLNLATKEELRRLHEAGLQLLEDHGILCESEAVLEICRNGGGIIERGSKVVKLERGLVEEALSRTPRSFLMPGLDPEMDPS
jgi:trimethylamine:corrinoid methyltransferase-like protein